MNGNVYRAIETMRAAGANLAWNEHPHAGIPAEVMVWGDVASVRRAAASVGLDFDRRSDKVTELSFGGYAVGTMVSDAGRASFTICQSAWPML